MNMMMMTMLIIVMNILSFWSTPHVQTSEACRRWCELLHCCLKMLSNWHLFRWKSRVFKVSFFHSFSMSEHSFIYLPAARIQAFETKCQRKLLWILLPRARNHDWVRSKINLIVDPQEPVLAIVKRRKLAWLGHVTRHDSFSKTILQGPLEGGRRRGRQRKCWLDKIKGWTSLPMPELLTRAFRRKDWIRRSRSRGSLLNRPSYFPEDPIGQGTELTDLNWTELLPGNLPF